jgi:hypothetical protein
LIAAEASAPWATVADGVIVTVRLTPRGGRDGLDGVETMANGRPVLKARVRAAPTGGEANAALVALLAKTLRIAPGRIAVVAGETARIKRVRIEGAGHEVVAALATIAQGRAT